MLCCHRALTPVTYQSVRAWGFVRLAPRLNSNWFEYILLATLHTPIIYWFHFEIRSSVIATQSEAKGKQSRIYLDNLDCHVATLLAMTESRLKSKVESVYH